MNTKQTLLDRLPVLVIMWLNKAKKMANEFSIFLQHVLQSNSKSTVLKSIGWLIVALMGGTAIASKYGVPLFIVAALGILTCLSILIFLAAFVYFALTNPALLRSEGHVYQMKALEQGYVGDNRTGFSRIVDITGRPQTESPPPLLNEGGGK